MKYRLMPYIRTPEDLGIAHLGDPRSGVAFVRAENRIDRAEYGRMLANMQGGRFTPFGYIVPNSRREHSVA